MALARTTRIGTASATSIGTAAYTTTSFTPADGSILVAAAFVGFSSANGTWAPTISDTAGGTWTQRASVSSTAGGWASGIRVWTRPVVTGASMTVSFDQGAVSVDGGYAVSIIEFTGQDGTTPQFGATAKVAAGTDGADNVVLTATPATADYALGFLGRDMNSGTATSSPGATGPFTELQDFTTSAGVGMESEERTGSTSTTVDWADLNTAAGDLFRIALATIGITAATGGSPQTWTGSAATVAIAASSGTFVPGVATWSGSSAAVAVAASSGTFTAGPVTWTGSAATIAVAATSGTFSAGGSPQTWNGTAGTVTATATSGTFVPDTATWAGSGSSVALNGISGVFIAGPVTWTGSSAAIAVAATSGVFVDVIPLIGGTATATVGVAGSGSTAITPGASASATVSQGTGTGATT